MTEEEIQASDEEIEKFNILQNEKCVLANEERAEKYFLSLELEKGNKIFQLKEVIEKMWKIYLDGLAEGRKELEKENEELKETVEYWKDEYYYLKANPEEA